MSTIWTVTVELARAEDAAALQELVGELGYVARVEGRDLSSVPEAHRSAMRDTRLGRIVLRRVPPADRTFTLEDVQDWCVQEDYAPGSASATLCFLVREGDVERVGPGTYRMVPR